MLCWQLNTRQRHAGNGMPHPHERSIDMATGKRRLARKAAAAAAAPPPVRKSTVKKKLPPIPAPVAAHTATAPIAAPKPAPVAAPTPEQREIRRWPAPGDMTPAELKRELADTKSRLQAVERRLQCLIELIRHELDSDRCDLRGMTHNAIRDYCAIEARHQREREDERQRHNARVVKYYESLRQG